MFKHSISQAASILGALVLWSALDGWIKDTIGRVAARGDVWTSGFEAGYDRGYSDGAHGSSRLHSVHGEPRH